MTMWIAALVFVLVALAPLAWIKLNQRIVAELEAINAEADRRKAIDDEVWRRHNA